MIVQCIDNDFIKGQDTLEDFNKRVDLVLKTFKEIPMLGGVYQVRSYINVKGNENRADTVGIMLEGINNDSFNGVEASFNIDRFKIIRLD